MAMSGSGGRFLHDARAWALVVPCSVCVLLVGGTDTLMTFACGSLIAAAFEKLGLPQVELATLWCTLGAVFAVLCLSTRPLLRGGLVALSRGLALLFIFGCFLVGLGSWLVLRRPWFCQSLPSWATQFEQRASELLSVACSVLGTWATLALVTHGLAALDTPADTAICQIAPWVTLIWCLWAYCMLLRPLPASFPSQAPVRKGGDKALSTEAVLIDDGSARTVASLARAFVLVLPAFVRFVHCRGGWGVERERLFLVIRSGVFHPSLYSACAVLALPALCVAMLEPARQVSCMRKRQDGVGLRHASAAESAVFHTGADRAPLHRMGSALRGLRMYCGLSTAKVPEVLRRMRATGLLGGMFEVPELVAELAAAYLLPLLILTALPVLVTATVLNLPSALALGHWLGDALTIAQLFHQCLCGAAVLLAIATPGRRQRQASRMKKKSKRKEKAHAISLPLPAPALLPTASNKRHTSVLQYVSPSREWYHLKLQTIVALLLVLLESGMCASFFPKALMTRVSYDPWPLTLLARLTSAATLEIIDTRGYVPLVLLSSAALCVSAVRLRKSGHKSVAALTSVVALSKLALLRAVARAEKAKRTVATATISDTNVDAQRHIATVCLPLAIILACIAIFAPFLRMRGQRPQSLGVTSCILHAVAVLFSLSLTVICSSGLDHRVGVQGGGLAFHFVVLSAWLAALSRVCVKRIRIVSLRICLAAMLGGCMLLFRIVSANYMVSYGNGNSASAFILPEPEWIVLFLVLSVVLGILPPNLGKMPTCVLAFVAGVSSATVAFAWEWARVCGVLLDLFSGHLSVEQTLFIFISMACTCGFIVAFGLLSPNISVLVTARLYFNIAIFAAALPGILFITITKNHHSSVAVVRAHGAVAFVVLLVACCSTNHASKDDDVYRPTWLLYNSRAHESRMHGHDLVVRQIVAFLAYIVCVMCAIAHQAVAGDNTNVKLLFAEISTRRFVPLCVLAIALLLPVNIRSGVTLYGPHQGARRRRYKRAAVGGSAAAASLGTAAVWHLGGAAIKAFSSRDQTRYIALTVELAALLSSLLCMYRAIRFVWCDGLLAPAQRARKEIMLLALLPPCAFGAISSASVHTRDLATLSTAMLTIALMACRTTGAAFERRAYGAHDDVI